ncbi:MAG: hypothetical protein UE295_07535, partial [Acutalibacteraceae bacterium]|nr:hypothetical protein [Acutalibacteraceae bacterium]
MKSRTFKKITSLVISFMLVLSMCITGISVSAANDEPQYVVAGVTELCGVGTTGYGWDPMDNTNVMTANGDGTYSKVYTDVVVKNDYQIKITATDSKGTTIWYGVDGGADNLTFNVVEACDVTVTFNPTTLQIKVTGAGVKIPTGLDIDAIYAVGNGIDTWLNGEAWAVSAKSNAMQEVAPNVYEITYTNVEKFNNYQVKFAANGSWAVNWGGVYKNSGVATEAWFNSSQNITFAVPYELANVTLRLDLTNFSYATKSGATFTVTVADVNEKPTEGPTDPPVKYDYTVAGDAGLTGDAWNPAANGMTDEDGDGVYTITFKDVPANSYSFKVTDGTWNNSWGVGADNYSITLTKQADVTINFNSETKEITVVSDGLGEFELEYIAVVGNGVEGKAWLNGEEWNPATTTNVLTQVARGVWTITYNSVDASDDYQFKFIANGGYTYNWTSDGVFDGQINPSNVVKYDGSTVTLTIDLTKYDFAKKEGKVVTSFSVKPPVEIPTEEPTEPVEVDYCLFGYIDGSNYGCEEDYETIGDYVFENGTVTAIFNETSYVGVKTTDNVDWFMTDDWAGEVKEVVLYDAATLDDKANKLMIPVTPGTSTKATFTLVENEDGTLTLSYKAETILPEKVAIYGDILVDLAETEDGIYTGVTELQAGTYKFNLNDMGVVRGMNFTYTDTASINYSAGYKAATTLNVTGGRYTFTYNATAKKLTIKFKSFEDI